MRFTLILALWLAACSDESEFAYLYDPPTGSATDTLYGTWGGAALTFDTRWVLTPNRIKLANKCGSTIVGVVVSASVDDSHIQILEAADDGGSSCFVHATPQTLTVCSSDPFDPKQNCFEHDGTLLTIYASDVDYLVLDKLTDDTD